MAKKKSPAELKAAKQKKIAIVGAVLFVIVLGIQVPRTLKMMKGTSAAPPPVAVAAPGGTDTTAAPGAAAPAAPVATPTTTVPTELVDSDPAPAAGPGQLVSFELFETKDPFAQQVDPNAVAAAPAADTSAPPADASAPSPDANPPAAPLPEPGASGSGGSGGSGGSVVPPAGAPAPAPAPSASPAAATSIAVNGVVESVAVDGTFPVADPSFVLVSLGADGKSVKIGVAGGSYADGKSAITLTMGKPLTLQNTASGARYELKLVSVLGSSARPKS